jgi:hypothetical protein
MRRKVSVRKAEKAMGTDSFCSGAEHENIDMDSDREIHLPSGKHQKMHSVFFAE